MIFGGCNGMQKIKGSSPCIRCTNGLSATTKSLPSGPLSPSRQRTARRLSGPAGEDRVA